ncbi:MAG: 4Fe-4S binding protein, partial [Planctomycetota bacterium]
MRSGTTIAIASGKGGTGKTTLAVNLACALAAAGERVQVLDCDVEEPDDHLFLQPGFTLEESVQVPKPVWTAERCTACGLCVEACAYNALALVQQQVLVFDELCHACGACSYVCPPQALQERPCTIGTVQGAPGHAPVAFAHGRLAVAESLAPAVVAATKRLVDPAAITLIDCAPGTACPVVEALRGADAVILVTEPTPFGLHDLQLAAALTLGMGLPTAIVVNRSDGEDRLIADWAASIGLPIAGRIPFRRDYAEAYASGALLVERFPALGDELRRLWRDLRPATPPAPELEAIALVPAAGKPVAAAVTDGPVREICVISGKGGTGKTTIAASFARLAGRQVLADTDVDAADLHLLLSPQVRYGADFVGGITATIDHTTCTSCGRCADHCHFSAIRMSDPDNDLEARAYRIDPLACEGCGLCLRVCPVQAISGGAAVVGRWFVSDTAQGPMVHARLGIGAENSGRLVSRVRQEAGISAREHGLGG